MQPLRSGTTEPFTTHNKTKSKTVLNTSEHLSNNITLWNVYITRIDKDIFQQRYFHIETFGKTTLRIAPSSTVYNFWTVISRFLRPRQGIVMTQTLISPRGFFRSNLWGCEICYPFEESSSFNHCGTVRLSLTSSFDSAVLCGV